MTTFTTDEKVSFLFKKSVGKPSTDTDLQFFSEPSISARPFVFTSQIFGDDIPVPRPSTGWQAPSNGVVPGTLAEQTKCRHSSNIIEFYHKWRLVKVTNGNSKSYKAADDGNGDNPLQGSVPFNLDPAGGYGLKLYRRNSNNTVGARIFDGTGDWVVDPDAGVLTFYEHSTVSNYVTEFNPPFLSFFRYVGSRGLSAASPWLGVTDGIKYNQANDAVLIGRDSSESPGSYKLEVNGDARFSGQVFAEELTCLSDRNTKTKIEAIRQPVSKICDVRGVQFRWKKNSRISYGVVADEMERALPHSTVRGPSGHQSVNYNAVIALLVETVKQQGRSLAKMQQQLDDLQHPKKKQLKCVVKHN